MKKVIIGLFLFVTIFGIIRTVNATVIDFEDCITGEHVTDQYRSLGVLFEGTDDWAGRILTIPQYGVSFFGNSGPNVMHIGNYNQSTTATFVKPGTDIPITANKISMLIGDGNTDSETFSVDFFDLYGKLLLSRTYTTTVNGVLVQFVGDAASFKITLEGSSSSGVVVDDISFTISSMPAHSYYLPYFSAQTNHWTGIALKNLNHQTNANTQVIIYSSDGNIQGTDEMIIPPRGQNNFVVGTGLSDLGWLQVNSDQPLAGLSFVGTNSDDNYMADIPFMSESSKILELPHVAQGPIYDTYIYLCNPNSASTTATITFVNTSGKIVKQLVKKLTANSSCVVKLLDMVTNQNISNSGSIEISATNPVIAFGLYENLKSGGYCYAGINAVIPW